MHGLGKNCTGLSIKNEKGKVEMRGAVGVRTPLSGHCSSWASYK